MTLSFLGVWFGPFVALLDRFSLAHPISFYLIVGICAWTAYCLAVLAGIQIAKRIVAPLLAPLPRRVISEADERRIYQSALSITQGRIQ